MKKYWFRITKYNPENRNELWHYIVDEWTAISDVEEYNIRWNEYKKVEFAYADFILRLLDKFNYKKLQIFSLVKIFKWREFSKLRIRWLWKEWKTLFKDIINERKKELSLNDISIYISFLLREMLWWFLIWEKIEIKTWYDYYMYVLTTDKNIYEYLKNVKDDILFIEEVGLHFFEKCEDWIEDNWYNENHLL